MLKLLALAERLCGRSLATSVLEPLIADWDRERREALPAQALARAALSARWSIAFVRTLMACTVRHFFSAESARWRPAVVVFVAAAALSIAAETVIIRLTVTPDYTWELLLIAALSRTGVATLAPAMLPAMFLLRRNPNVRGRVAAVWMASGATMLALAVIAQRSIESYTPTFAQTERMHQRALANDRAGKLQYPGTALRALRNSTIEQRKASYDAYLAQRARSLAGEPRRPVWHHLRYSTAPLMAVLFGMLGWGLAGVRRPTVTAAATWWLAAWATSLLIEGRIPSIVGFPRPRIEWWVFPAAIAAIVVWLLLLERRRPVSSSSSA